MNTPFTSDGTEPAEREPFVILGVCAMAKKAKSKYMTEILTRITSEFDQIRTIIFDEQQILHEPVSKNLTKFYNWSDAYACVIGNVLDI